MADNLQPGTFSDVATTTMAQAMERTFVAQWPLFNPDLPPPAESQLKPMRLFFVAVAQGVVQHLRDNPTALEVEVNNGGTTLDGEVVQVNTSGTTA